MSCITSNSTIDVLDPIVDAHILIQTGSSITITFTNSNPNGTLGAVGVTPSGPTTDSSAHTITFTDTNCTLDTDYKVTVEYTDPTTLDIMETPTKKLKFRPVSTCP